MVTTDKETLQYVLTCLQASQAKVELLQIQTQLLHDELQRKNIQHSELVLVQKNPLFDDDDDDDSDQQPVQEQLSEPTSYTSADEDEVVHEQVQLSLSKPIIRPWEEIRDNKHITCIRYEKEVTFHILDYTKPIQFQSVGFLQESSYSPAPVQEKIPKCQHCHRVGHMEDQCFDLHPCEHCGKHNHPSDRCSKHKKLQE
jgi:hypothetical protein